MYNGGILMNFKKYISIIICTSIIISNTCIGFAEEITESYTGISNAQGVLSNIDFRDISPLPDTYWAKDAIYKMASLSIIQGYGEKSYKPSNSITKAEAIALIYRALGKEADAKKEAERLEQQRSEELKKNNPRNIWADGYLSLAQKEGLITQEQFEQATNPEEASLDSGINFNPNSTAQRQEVAVWIAKAFKMEPSYNQTMVFNNYNDWQQIDYDKIPYVETLLKSKIMNGDNGYFYPKNSIRRDEMAQVLSNMEDDVFKQNNLSKKVGFVENILTESNRQTSREVVTRTISVRLDNGVLANIILTSDGTEFNAKNGELGSHGSIISDNEIIVNKDGTLGKSDLLNINDEILFVYDNDKKIKFVEAKTSKEKEKLLYGTIDNVDAENNTLSFVDLYNSLYTYPVSLGATISIYNEGKSLEEVPFASKAYITLNHNMITRIEVSNTKKAASDLVSEQTDVRGIVQEINPVLNYISLYDPEGRKDPKYIRTYNFSPNVEVNKNGNRVSVNEIEVGDMVYLKFDKESNIEQINVESNYISAYGDVLFVGKNFIIVKYEDDATQQLDINDGILMVKEGKVISRGDINVGDRVKLTLNRNDSNTQIKAINVEGEQHYISKLYKGKVYEIDGNNLVLYNAKVLNKNKWISNPQRGFNRLELDDAAKIYYNNKAINLNEARNVYPNKNVYVAAYKDYGYNEKAAMVSLNDGFEKIYNDDVVSHSQSSKSIALSNSFDNIRYSDGTIIVRYGRLTIGNNIKINDPIYTVALRDSSKDTIMAGIINITDKPSILGIDIYRGKITSIEEGHRFTLESFSLLKGTNWEFINTPKTFDLNNDTKILSSQGLVNNRDFIDYSSKGYKDKIVYIATKGSQAFIVSDAQYGVINLKGEVYNITSGTGKTALNLKNVVVLSSTTGEWNNLADSTIDILTNSIIVKNKKIAEAQDLEKGDKVRIIKKDNTNTGEGFIVLVEG